MKSHTPVGIDSMHFDGIQFVKYKGRINSVILDKTLLEEEIRDPSLSRIAESAINPQAENEGTYSWQQNYEMEEA